MIMFNVVVNGVFKVSFPIVASILKYNWLLYIDCILYIAEFND